MSCFDVLDPRFASFIMGNAPVKKLATGFDWVEGPVWFGDAGCLLFSDIPNNRILRWTPEGISTFRAPSNYANGHTRDREGRLISCEHGLRRVTRTELDGTITVIADSYQGKRFNSPNDVVVTRDGTISELKLVETSGSRLFDEAALRAVQSSSPLPPLPKGYVKDSLGIHLLVK